MTYSTVGPVQWMILVELCLALLAVLVAVFWPKLFLQPFASFESICSRIADTKRLSLALAILIPLSVRVLILPIYPPPPPVVPDDYSYLFLGETFALGRVANPTPPLPEHFDAKFELLSPTFSSQYQPAQGLILAAGKLIMGNAWWGTLLSGGAFFGVMCWALQAVLPRRWAFVGSMVFAGQFGIFGMFMNTYRGATMAAIGGALVFGALARLRRCVKPFYVSVAGVGIVLLMASRPVESVIWLGLSCFAIIRFLNGPPRAILFFQLFAIVAAGATGLAVYNFKVTGSAFELPYTRYQKLYGTQGFWWQPPFTSPSAINHPDQKKEYEHQLSLHSQRSSVQGIWTNAIEKGLRVWQFFLGPILTIPFMFCMNLTRIQKNWPWLIAIFLFALDHLTFHAWYPNQSAPEYALIGFLVVQCWRYMRCSAVFGRRSGKPVSRWLAVAGLLTILLPIVGRTVEPVIPSRLIKARAVWYCEFITDDLRSSVVSYLKQQPGKHLVFIDWSNILGTKFEDWFYNDPDLKSATVVWARSLSPERDGELARTLRGRHTWRLNGQHLPPTVTEYDPGLNSMDSSKP